MQARAHKHLHVHTVTGHIHTCTCSSLCNSTSTVSLLVTVTSIMSTFTVAVHVYCPASDVFIGLNMSGSESVVLVRTGPTLMVFSVVSPPSLTVRLIHTISGGTINPATTTTVHVSMTLEPGDAVPLDETNTVGGGRAGG